MLVPYSFVSIFCIVLLTFQFAFSLSTFVADVVPVFPAIAVIALNCVVFDS